MSGQAFVGTAKRTFGQAVLHLLETQYGVLNSHKVLELLAEDLQRLAEQFYPRSEHLCSGWMVFTGTKAQGQKARPGQSASDHQLVTLAWPVLTAEDLQELTTLPDQAGRSRACRRWLKKRLIRLVEYVWHHAQGPVLLTLADLGAMLNLSTVEASGLLSEARRDTGLPLVTKGYYFDQGMRPTHKEEIITLYESGLDETEIARSTRHAQSSVGRYIRDYERVKLLAKRHSSAREMSRLLEMQPGVVQAYLAMVNRYHPEILATQDVTPID